jgi:hypothetical protein
MIKMHNALHLSRHGNAIQIQFKSESHHSFNFLAHYHINKELRGFAETFMTEKYSTSTF